MAGITPEYAAEMTNIYTRLEGGGIGGWDKDIGRDLNRTWPDVEMFKEQDGRGQRGLRGVLGGYSVWDNTVGYCQGYLSPQRGLTNLETRVLGWSFVDADVYPGGSIHTPHRPHVSTHNERANRILSSNSIHA